MKIKSFKFQLFKHIYLFSGNLNKLFLLVFFSLILFSCTGNKNELTLVKNGKAKSAIILPQDLNELQNLAIKDFIHTIFRSSGALIPVVSELEAEKLPAATIRIIPGPSTTTEKLGYKTDDMKEEEFRIISKDNSIIILAKDIEEPVLRSSSMVTAWAFSYILDHFLGVRWLWPGELGTVVPKHKTISLPVMDINIQQKLLQRRLNHKGNPETVMWTSHHQSAGKRINYTFSHSFMAGRQNGDWWNMFHKTHPEYFAKDPSGKIDNPSVVPDRIKLCLSNQGVREEIVRIWEEAGKPNFWDVTSNDGGGWCTCDNCRALDLKFGDVTYTKEEIWSRPEYVSLTDRYVWHWNTLIKMMREKNPEVKIGVYFYSAYRNPPKKLKLEDGIVGVMVHGYDFDFWKAWKESGASEIGLRPNWWHMGACGPHLPLHTVGKYIETARKEGMILISMDSLMEYWAAQGPYYYLVARLIARPDLTTDDIITEYCETFGKAADDIRRYLNYWEKYHEKVAYNVPAGGALSQNPNGLYEKISIEKFGKVLHPLNGHWRTMPFIYNSKIMDEARDILNQAEKRADNNEIRLRINFMQDGLNQVDKVIAFLEAPKDEQSAALKDLADFSMKKEKEYGYWGRNGIDVMKHRGVIGKSVSLEGL